MNAAGCVAMTPENLSALDEEDTVGAVVTKSFTVQQRNGNAMPRIGFQNQISINSVGLANPGHQAIQSISLSIKRKPCIVSVHPFTVNELILMLKNTTATTTKTASIIEINLSCPNVDIQDSFYSRLEQFVPVIYRHSEFLTIGMKLPPLIYNYERLASLIRESNVAFVTCCNTLPNGLLLDMETKEPLIKQDTGGIGGIGNKPFALKMVFELYKRLGDTVSIVGCGGIFTAHDVFEYIFCGASAVQLGTSVLQNGISFLSKLATETTILCAQNKIEKLSTMRGFVHRKKTRVPIQSKL